MEILLPTGIQPAFGTHAFTKGTTMQRILTILTVFVFITLFIGCSDDPASGNTNTSHGSMSAKVDGTAWDADNVTQATWANGVLGFGGAQINGGNNKQIIITGLVAEPGEYAIGGITGLQGNYSDGSGSSIRTFTATSGTLVVQELSESGAKGTFSFEAKEQNIGGSSGNETRSITNGSFNITF